MLIAPIDHPLNLTMQTILTVGSWAITLAFLFAAFRKGRQQQTPFFLLLVIAGGIGGIFEPLYDVGFKLLFYVPGQWTMFSAFGVPQPVWTISGYVTLFSGPAMLIADRIANGMSREALQRWFAVLIVTTAAFEMTGINGEAYEYWGAHALRIFQYPLVVGVLEAAMVVTLGVAAAAFRARATSSWQLVGLVPLFLIVFYGVNFGLGAPTLVAIALSPASPILVSAATLLSIAMAAAAVWSLSLTLPSSRTSTRRSGALHKSNLHFLKN
ncbi:MAG TPA: hypothetical protein VGI79_07465 [Caulobacteraceae bacterium]|jgi:uncharacterized protein YodC (DUF2158 family)